MFKRQIHKLFLTVLGIEDDYVYAHSFLKLNKAIIIYLKTVFIVTSPFCNSLHNLSYSLLVRLFALAYLLINFILFFFVIYRITNTYNEHKTGGIFCENYY